MQSQSRNYKIFSIVKCKEWSVKSVVLEIKCVLHKNCQIIINFNTLACNIESTQAINFCILTKFQTILITISPLLSRQ